MEQHPIPQQISSYQFKLVGDMTLKQFFQVAGGALIGLIFYSTGLHGLIKWPLILLSTGLGAAMAFLPFEERPLEKWIISFFRSVYSPTIYTWKKSDKPPVYYTEDATPPLEKGTTQKVSDTYLASTPQDKEHAKMEVVEKSFLSKLTSLLSINLPTTSSVKPVVAPTQQQPSTNDQKPTTIQPMKIPTQKPTLIPKSVTRLIVEEKPRPVDTTVQAKMQKVVGLDQKQTPIASKTVHFSIDAAPPHPPTIVNTITGQVMDGDRKIIAGAILEIKDTQGRPVRALKSNMAGHFIIVTSLADGKYEIKTEKEGFKFEPVSFETTGEMIPPMAISGVKLKESQNENKTT